MVTRSRGSRRKPQPLVEPDERGVAVLGDDPPLPDEPVPPAEPQLVALTAPTGTCVTVPADQADGLRRQGYR